MVVSAGLIPLTIEALQEDILVSIADQLDVPSDFQNLRLVDKRFHSAVGQSAVWLQPSMALTTPQLLELSRLFGKAASLNLSRCAHLNNESLRGLHSLFPRLRQLDLGACSWLTAAGLEHLRSLSRLQFLTLYNCTGLKRLPQSICAIASLRGLSLASCANLQFLPNDISGLKDLRWLSLWNCTKLVQLPESIGSLSLRQHLDLGYSR